ncbi:MAG: FAD-binding oxidoreductase [Chloroflexota bacterium]|jgi:glycolate oxidase FAD binding subunit
MTLAAQGSESTRARLAEIVGPDNVLAGEKGALYSAFGEQPLAAVLPSSEKEIADVVKVANAEKVQVVVWGSGSKQDVEPVQTREGIVLGTTKLVALDLDAANLTVAVGAGMLVDELQAELAKARLFLPLDPVDSARSTIGGMLATNSSGPNRLLYRTARDMVLGMRIVTPFGQAIKVGGKTVKDVAGYDMKKLYIGSWGTLGAITEATFRLLPLPEAKATVAMIFSQLSGSCNTVGDILASFMRPSTAELISSGALPADAEFKLGLKQGEYLLAVQVEGAKEAVDRQKKDLQELARKREARALSILEGTEEATLWQQRKLVFARMPKDRPAMLVKGSVLIKRVIDFVGGLIELQENHGLQVAFASHAGNGIVYSLISAEQGQEERLVTAAGELQQLAARCGGFAIPLKASQAISKRLQYWPPRDDYGVMQRIKAQLDPNNLWSPARTPGGRA